MSARDTTPFFKYVAERAMRKGSRVRNLRGTEGKPAVISMTIDGEVRRVWVPGAVVAGAAARLLAPGKLAKLPPKPGKGDRWRLKPVDLIELLPKPLQEKMQQLPPPIGNLQLQRPLTDDPRWLALEAVYKQLFELSPVWDVRGAARVELIDNAVDAELKAYKKATSDVGGSSTPLKSDTKLFDLERYTETGFAYRDEPTRRIDWQDHIDAYDAAKETRRKEAEEEFARLVPLLRSYANMLTAKQREAWRLICTDSELTGEAIADASGVSTGKVSQLRNWFAEMTRRLRALCEPLEDDAPADVPLEAVTGEEEEPETLGADVELDRNKNPKALSGELTLEPVQDSGVDVDLDCPENVARGYARMRANERLLGGAVGRRTYDLETLVTGAYKPNQRDLHEMARAPGEENLNIRRRITQTAARHLQRKAREAGFDVDGALRAIDEHIERRIREFEIAEAEAALFRALLRVDILRAAELTEPLSWVEPWCKEKRVSVDELFGMCIDGEKSRDSFNQEESAA